MAQIMWVISILFIGFISIADIDPRSLMILAPTLVGISLLITLLVWKKIIEDKLMYVVTAGLCLVHYLFVYMFHYLNGLLIGFIVLLIIALYQHSKSVFLAAILIISTIIYGYFTGGEKMFGSFYNTTGLIIVVFEFRVMVLLISAQVKTSEGIRKDIQLQKDETDLSKQEVETVLASLKSSISNLMSFSQSLQKNVTTSDRIGAELATSFKDVSENVASQTGLITKINSEIDLETNYIDEIAKESSLMRSLSENTLSKTQECNIEIGELSGEM